MATHSSIPAYKIQGQRSLVGHSPWGHKVMDTNEWLGMAEQDKKAKEEEILSMGQFLLASCILGVVGVCRGVQKVQRIL